MSDNTYPRVSVTFPDGTVIIGIKMDWSFSSFVAEFREKGETKSAFVAPGTPKWEHAFDVSGEGKVRIRVTLNDVGHWLISGEKRVSVEAPVTVEARHASSTCFRKDLEKRKFNKLTRPAEVPVLT